MTWAEELPGKPLRTSVDEQRRHTVRAEDILSSEDDSGQNERAVLIAAPPGSTSGNTVSRRTPARADDERDDTHAAGHDRECALPYKKVATGEPTYDFNCDGVESERAGVTHFTPPCNDDCSTGGLGPARSGRKGPGVNDYCGSNVLLRCARQVAEPIKPSSVPIDFAMIQPFAEELENPACGVTSGETAPNGCR